MRVASWLGLTVGTFAGGAGLAFLGDRNRRFASQIEFFSRLSATIQVDQGLAESLRLFLEELATTFGAEEALMLYRDTDLERIFLWRLKVGESERLVPESMPLSRTDGFLLDDMDATICWNSLAGSGSGFGWDRRDGRALQHPVRNERAELRQTVTDLRPLRVQSADLVDLMRGFAERYRNESTIALDLLIDSAQLRAPDRVCREIFQIYREALNNIKKHAKASHVVVKLSQDDSRLVLVVDDNGEGFSFAGRFTADELDRLRLGPISLKERSRTVWGVLTVESNPGHGARLTIEVPLG